MDAHAYVASATRADHAAMLASKVRKAIAAEGTLTVKAKGSFWIKSNLPAAVALDTIKHLDTSRVRVWPLNCGCEVIVPYM